MLGRVPIRGVKGELLDKAFQIGFQALKFTTYEFESKNNKTKIIV